MKTLYERPVLITHEFWKLWGSFVSTESMLDGVLGFSLCKKRSHSDLFWSVFSRIRSESSLRIRENTDQNISKYGHFSCSALQLVNTLLKRITKIWRCSIVFLYIKITYNNIILICWIWEYKAKLLVRKSKRVFLCLL